MNGKENKMELIIGGAYQGKRDWAKAQFSLTDADIFTCRGLEVDGAKRCVCHLEAFTLACAQAGLDPREVWDFAASRDKILIADDISCGVVPTDALTRAWREDTGRFLTQLAAQADRVTRIFCGLPVRLKG
jgi:adenosyl cobinamide kinase/adenosyl cobinamide phosphate guanylyltransferase